MMNNKLPQDYAIRQQALDVAESFIVQAPAGSGKTELLIQRYLNLLAHACESPEEIIAITFTRKAANEMRNRLLDALEIASESMPEEEHKQITWRLAKAVADKDKAHQWNLLENPQRLRIQTIDALSAFLVQQMPLLTKLGARPTVLEDCRHLYELAAQSLIEQFSSDESIRTSMQKLLLHLNNRYEQVKILLADMLSKRDQWIPHVMQAHQADDLQSQIECSFSRVIKEKLSELSQYLESHNDYQELINLVEYAARNSGTIDESEPFSLLPRTEDLKCWLFLSASMLTAQFEWRKQVTVKQGFPSKSAGETSEEKEYFDNRKKAMKSLLDKLNYDDKLRELLIDIAMLPNASYSENQWQILVALFTLLPRACAELFYLFQQHQHVDFIELSLAALRGMGDETEPTDLALSLDYSIKHLLIDEFQDTSITHYSLVEKLINGWQDGDGRTLFLVGDPMQSIYRFRDADVGLFMKTQQFGIANLAITDLRLTVNFRSQATIVNWVNDSFDRIFPKDIGFASGAVVFNKAEAFQTCFDDDNNAVNFVFNSKNELVEASHIVEIIQRETQSNSKQSIAILVRTRSHLVSIIPALIHNNIAFNAIDIEHLAQQTVIQDLLSLTRALLHIDDRTAWLAVLRAPWCGLALHDIHLIANESDSIWGTLDSILEKDLLSVEAKGILARIIPTLKVALHERGRQPLAQWVEGVWYSLGGNSVIQKEIELAHAQCYFDLLHKIELQNNDLDASVIERALLRLFAVNQTNETNIHIMTIHKSKGLEFDTVIMPGLDKTTRPESQQLLMWSETMDYQHSKAELIVAPIRSPNDYNDKIYNYLWNENKIKAIHEATRLFYVAITRAKQKLYLCATLLEDENNVVLPPKANSFLGLLWPQLYAPEQFVQTTRDDLLPSRARIKPELERLPVNWSQPEDIQHYTNSFNAGEKIHFDRGNHPSRYQPPLLRILGECLHQLFADIFQSGLETWNEQKIEKQLLICRTALISAGFPIRKIPQTLVDIKSTLIKTFNSSYASWLFSQHYEENFAELTLNYLENEQLQQVRLDRTFIDNSCCWIIDYKFTFEYEAFTEDILVIYQQKYKAQLEKYAKILSRLRNYPIKLGLYFPYQDAWIDWSYLEQKEREGA